MVIRHRFCAVNTSWQQGSECADHYFRSPPRVRKFVWNCNFLSQPQPGSAITFFLI